MCLSCGCGMQEGEMMEKMPKGKKIPVKTVKAKKSTAATKKKVTKKTKK